MLGRYAPGRANIITHIHTSGSGSNASELDDVIGAALRRVDGEDTKLGWSECFTPIEKLQDMVRRGSGRHGPVHMVLVTDHMRARSHRLPVRHLEIAASDPKIALGAELATRTRDTDGIYRKGPEILAYGGASPVEGPHGPYFGLSTLLLEELYDTCLDPDGQELCTRRARDLLGRRGVAHALSHPFDGHHLGLVGTFAVISEFAFVETVNGGFFADSARALEAYIRFNNSILEGLVLPEEAIGPDTGRIIRHIMQHGRPVHAWSGSDAHSHDLDRVVISMALDRGRDAATVSPGDLFAAMLDVMRHPETGAGATVGGPSPLFTSLGSPGTPVSQLVDVAAIVARNLYRAWRITRSPIRLVRLFGTTCSITSDQLTQRRRTKAGRMRALREGFDPEALLRLLQLPHGASPARASRALSVA